MTTKLGVVLFVAVSVSSAVLGVSVNWWALYEDRAAHARLQVIRAAAAKCPETRHLTDDLQCVDMPASLAASITGAMVAEQVVVPAADEYAMMMERKERDDAIEANRRGRELETCRLLRREQLCAYSLKQCNMLRPMSMDGSTSQLTQDETHRCMFACATGHLYVEALESSVWSKIRTMNGGQAKDSDGRLLFNPNGEPQMYPVNVQGKLTLLWKELAACKSGRDLEATGVPLPSMDIR